jgi:hypothetical protein
MFTCASLHPTLASVQRRQRSLSSHRACSSSQRPPPRPPRTPSHTRPLARSPDFADPEAAQGPQAGGHERHARGGEVPGLLPGCSPHEGPGPPAPRGDLLHAGATHVVHERKKERSTPVSRHALRGHSVNEDHQTSCMRTQTRHTGCSCCAGTGCPCAAHSGRRLPRSTTPQPPERKRRRCRAFCGNSMPRCPSASAIACSRGKHLLVVHATPAPPAAACFAPP